MHYDHDCRHFVTSCQVHDTRWVLWLLLSSSVRGCARMYVCGCAWWCEVTRSLCGVVGKAWLWFVVLRICVRSTSTSTSMHSHIPLQRQDKHLMYRTTTCEGSLEDPPLFFFINILQTVIARRNVRQWREQVSKKRGRSLCALFCPCGGCFLLAYTDSGRSSWLNMKVLQMVCMSAQHFILCELRCRW